MADESLGTIYFTVEAESRLQNQTADLRRDISGIVNEVKKGQDQQKEIIKAATDEKKRIIEDGMRSELAMQKQMQVALKLEMERQKEAIRQKEIAKKAILEEGLRSELAIQEQAAVSMKLAMQKQVQAQKEAADARKRIIMEAENADRAYWATVQRLAREGAAKEEAQAQALIEKRQSAMAARKQNYSNTINMIGGVVGGAIAFGGISSLISDYQAAKQALDDQFVAQEQLRVSLGYTNKDLDDYAEKMRTKTKFDDDQIRQAEALAAEFIKDDQAIKDVTGAAMNLAAAKKMDLATATDLVTKSVVGSTNMLSRYGVEITGARGSVERLNSAVNGLNKAFGGQAEAMANTDTNPLWQMKKDIEDIHKSIALEILPLEETWLTIQRAIASSAGKYLQWLSEGAKIAGRLLGGQSVERIRVERTIDEAMSEKDNTRLFDLLIEKNKELSKATGAAKQDLEGQVQAIKDALSRINSIIAGEARQRNKNSNKILTFDDPAEQKKAEEEFKKHVENEHDAIVRAQMVEQDNYNKQQELMQRETAATTEAIKSGYQARMTAAKEDFDFQASLLEEIVSNEKMSIKDRKAAVESLTQLKLASLEIEKEMAKQAAQDEYTAMAEAADKEGTATEEYLNTLQDNYIEKVQFIENHWGNEVTKELEIIAKAKIEADIKEFSDTLNKIGTEGSWGGLADDIEKLRVAYRGADEDLKKKYDEQLKGSIEKITGALGKLTTNAFDWAKKLSDADKMTSQVIDYMSKGLSDALSEDPIGMLTDVISGIVDAIDAGNDAIRKSQEDREKAEREQLQTEQKAHQDLLSSIQNVIAAYKDEYRKALGLGVSPEQLASEISSSKTAIGTSAYNAFYQQALTRGAPGQRDIADGTLQTWASQAQTGLESVAGKVSSNFLTDLASGKVSYSGNLYTEDFVNFLNQNKAFGEGKTVSSQDALQIAYLFQSMNYSGSADILTEFQKLNSLVSASAAASNIYGVIGSGSTIDDLRNINTQLQGQSGQTAMINGKETSLVSYTDLLDLAQRIFDSGGTVDEYVKNLRFIQNSTLFSQMPRSAQLDLVQKIENPPKPSGSSGSTLHLAEGGIAMGPTMAQIAEAGEPEAVVPLSKLGQVMGMLSDSGVMNGGYGGSVYHINIPVNIPEGAIVGPNAARIISEQIAEKTNRLLRSRGYREI